MSCRILLCQPRPLPHHRPQLDRPLQRLPPLRPPQVFTSPHHFSALPVISPWLWNRQSIVVFTTTAPHAAPSRGIKGGKVECRCWQRLQSLRGRTPALLHQRGWQVFVEGERGDCDARHPVVLLKVVDVQQEFFFFSLTWCWKFFSPTAQPNSPLRGSTVHKHGLFIICIHNSSCSKLSHS